MLSNTERYAALQAEPHVCNDELCPPSGGYYVSAVDGPQFWLMAGPYNTHAEALADVKRVRDICVERDSTGRAVWKAWGTLRMKDETRKPGKLNELGLI